MDDVIREWNVGLEAQNEKGALYLENGYET